MGTVTPSSVKLNDKNKKAPQYTVEIQYDGLERTGLYWLLNPNVINRIINFCHFFVQKRSQQS